MQLISLSIVFSCCSHSGLRQAFRKTQDDDNAHPWPAQAVLDVGVPFTTLIESYDSIYMRESIGSVGGVDAATR